jgi:hypothetical protein
MPHCEEGPVYGVDYGDDNIVNSLNGDIYAAGIKIDMRAWLDMGSSEWHNTDPSVRAAAFKAAINAGWTENGLSAIMVRNFKHLTPADMEMAFEILKSGV